MMNDMQKGIVYGVGVGTGDPELMTLKAVRLIRENHVIAVPGKSAEDSRAYKIAVQSVPELANKELVSIEMPMTKDIKKLTKAHQSGADLIKSYLDKGINVVYLTIGDPTVYCSFSYLQHILENDNYVVELVSGVASFCAAAARLGIPLCEGEEKLHILPSAPCGNNVTVNDDSAVYAILKTGRDLNNVKSCFSQSYYNIYAVENIGTKDERIFRNSEEFPEKSDYFTTIIARKK